MACGLLSCGMRASYLQHAGLSCGMRTLSCGMRTLSCSRHVGSSSPTRDQTQAPCIGSAESYPLDHQGIPSFTLYTHIYHFWHSSFLPIYSINIKYHFLSVQRAFFRISYREGLLAMNSLCFCLSGKISISVFILKGYYFWIYYSWFTFVSSLSTFVVCHYTL